MKNNIMIIGLIIVLLAVTVFAATTLTTDRAKDIDAKIIEEARLQGITAEEYKEQIAVNYVDSKLDQELRT